MRLIQKNDICSEAGLTNCPQSPDDTPARAEWWTKGAPGASVDYDGDGVNHTVWRDLAGSTISCPTPGTPLDLGAIRNGSDALR